MLTRRPKAVIGILVRSPRKCLLRKVSRRDRPAGRHGSGFLRFVGSSRSEFALFFSRCADNKALNSSGSKHLLSESPARELFAREKFWPTENSNRNVSTPLRYRIPSSALEDFATVTWTRSRRLWPFGELISYSKSSALL
jgi:hypothetical protein